MGAGGHDYYFFIQHGELHGLLSFFTIFFLVLFIAEFLYVTPENWHFTSA